VYNINKVLHLLLKLENNALFDFKLGNRYALHQVAYELVTQCGA
jgi:hypothetical protein